jgi:hypothetical protein
LPKAPPPRVIATPHAAAPPVPQHLEATMPSEHGPPGMGARPAAPARPGAAPASGGNGSGDLAEWRAVYEEFVRTKQQCGESVDGFTYEKFEQTLKKNRDALVQRHGAKRVKFSVYVKEGKAALKASPIKE